MSKLSVCPALTRSRPLDVQAPSGHGWVPSCPRRIAVRRWIPSYPAGRW